MTYEDHDADLTALLALPQPARQAWLSAHPDRLTDAFVEALKLRADAYCGSDIEGALQLAELLRQAAALTGRDDFRALGLLAKANAELIGLHEYAAAVDAYGTALSIYRRLGRAVEAAKVVSGRLYPLARLGRLAEAYADFEWAREVLRSQGQLRPLANLLMNFGALLGDQGADREALARFDEAAGALCELGDAQSEVDLAGVDQNRSVVLRNLGRFEESINASQQAVAVLARLDQPIEAARAKQNLGMTYVEMGDFMRGLGLVEVARDAFAEQRLPRQMMRLELYSAACLLDIGRPQDVIDRVPETKRYFDEHDSPLESGQAEMLTALACMSLGRVEAAALHLESATGYFLRVANPLWLARVYRHRAKVLARLERFSESRQAMEQAAVRLDAQSHQPELLRLRLDQAEVAMASGDLAEAERLLGELAAGDRSDPVPLLRFDFHRLRAELARTQRRLSAAMTCYDLALGELERVRGRLQSEFYGDFVANKEIVYEQAVQTALEAGLPRAALELVERGKARSLVDSLSGRLTQPVRQRQPEDQPLVAELNQLIAERDRLIRRWQGSEDNLESLESGTTDAQHGVVRRVAEVEKSIEGRWRRLLMQSGEYAADSALVQVGREDIGAIIGHLPADTAAIAYFSAGDRLLAFVANQSTVTCRELGTTWSVVRPLIRFLHMNFSELPRSMGPVADQSRHEAAGILARLHTLLFDPVQDLVRPFAKVIVVPHADLHYVPFHALLDRGRFLVEERELSYLPSLSTLRHIRLHVTTEPKVAVFGRSGGGKLPGTLQEAETIGGIWGVAPMLEDEATLGRVREEAARCQVLHLATHGTFRPDSPAFSSLSLSDGELTTLRILNDLRLDGSLVVLSACETGQGTIGGGDELQGLMRAFLYRGASALVMTIWQAADAASAPLMAHYHSLLSHGRPMADALCDAQRSFLHEARAAAHHAYTHPFFWAPFIHVGHVGPIKEEIR